MINQNEVGGTFDKLKEQLYNIIYIYLICFRSFLDELIKNIQMEYDISDTNFLSRYLDLHTKISLVIPQSTTPQQFAELNNEIDSFITELNNYKSKIDKINPLLLEIQNDMYYYNFLYYYFYYYYLEIHSTR